MIQLQIDRQEHAESAIAKEILANDLIYCLEETDEFAIYNGGVFHKGKEGRTEIRERITQYAEKSEYAWTDGNGVAHTKPYHLTIAKRREIVEQIKTRNFISLNEFDNNPKLLNVKNGVISLEPYKKILPNPNTEDGHYGSGDKLITEEGYGTFVPHSNYGWCMDPSTFINGQPQFHPPPKCFIQLPVNYNPKAECLEIDQFLSDIFGFERVPFIYEMIAYFIVPTIKFGKAFILYGPTKTGKTSFINLIQQFVGGDHPERIISHVRVQDLSERFEAENLRNKLLNIFDDLKEHKIIASDFFRLFVTNKTISSAIKHVQGNVTWRNYCKQLYACNQLPVVPKKTGDEFWNRWILIQCFNEFKNENCNIEIRDQKWSNQELSGLLNKCIQAWQRLEKRKKFPTEYDDIERVKGTWLIDVNPVKLFVDERCDFYNEAFTIGYKEFKRAVNKFREEHNAKPITQTMCTQSLGRIDDKIEKKEWGAKKRREYGERYYYKGIRIRPEFRADELEIKPKVRLDDYADERRFDV